MIQIFFFLNTVCNAPASSYLERAEGAGRSQHGRQLRAVRGGEDGGGGGGGGGDAAALVAVLALLLGPRRGKGRTAR